jgi:ABC-2 type transport system ATP-binding protein
VTTNDHAIEASDLGRRFRRTWGLKNCTITIPRGRVAALVGPNGAGKSTLLRIAAGLIPPTTGSLKVLGVDVTSPTPDLLRRVGYLDQDRPSYSSFKVSEMLHFGRDSNPKWNSDVAIGNLARLNIPLDARVSELSGGQRAQVALTVCMAKMPELLLLDEPAAALDPVAREDLLRLLMKEVADSGSSVILSTHSLGDVSSVCDYVVILSNSRVVLANDIEFILESHRLLSSDRKLNMPLPNGAIALEDRHSARETSVLARIELPIMDSTWHIESPTLDEIVMAYLRLDPSLDLEFNVAGELR